ncbi:AfsR/SARP family transcriptional regulator [Streptomyces sp. CA-210063]|uniref:AfsR/SARP family transcriptional regulator n=1 Tax=Streptomyces sp. CA-210063 TaxID=2801029 RepID=UPI0027D46D42|nr:BTAD domain-containing putative transcriptional regulator [Streptomyces sp. CA-210063]
MARRLYATPLGNVWKKRNHLGEVVHLLALGPLELWHGGRQYPLGSLKERRVLAVLLYAQGDPVAVDTLVERVWDDDEVPVTAVETLHTYLSRLRNRLRRAVGELAQLERTSPRRYRLRVQQADDVDFVRLRRLRDEARTAAGRGDREYAVGLLHTAASLWRGEPFAEFTGDWAASARARLTEDHRHIRQERIRLELELGRHADLLGELHELVSLNPLAQQAVAALMLALYRSGRDGEALNLYRTTRHRLSEELGIDPGTELQELQLRILGQDPGLRAHRPAAVEPGAGQGGGVRAADRGTRHPGSSLPRDTRDFTGRTSELDILLADRVPDGNGTALPVDVVHGMPGVGKSALIVHAAHRLRGRYPAGQFYVDLRAYGDQPPYDPADALAFLLHTVGVPDPLPVTLDERTALWREWTAQHRVLVVLDNARDAEQIRPLLPGSPDCRAIVASRNRLTELDGATSLFLDVLSVSEAGALFARIAGAARVSDTAALRRVVELCGRHPLTLQLHASRFRHRDTWDLEYVADRLEGAGDRLEEFDERVAAALQMSCADLDAPARRLFRRLALHPGPDITLEAAMALSGDVEPGAVRRAAESLLDRHLLDEPVRDRYQLHDLARAFGGRLSRREDPPAERGAALRRLMSYYLTASDRADRLAHPRRRRRPVPPELTAPIAPGFTTGPRADSAADEASVWLTVERGNLLAVARTAATEFPEFAALFPHVLAHCLQRWGTHDITAELHAAALTALRSGEDRAALAQLLVERASVLARENHSAALAAATEALTLFEQLGDPRGRADALLEIGRAHLGAGRGEACLRELDRCLVLYRAVDDRHGVAATLNVQGTARVHRAEYAEATHCFRTMLGMTRELRDRHGQALAWNNLGDIRLALGLHEEARDHYERAMGLMREVGGKKEIAILDTNLGAVYSATGQPGRALTSFRRALASHRAGGDAIGEVNTLICLGETCAGSGRTEEALSHFRAAEEVARRIDNAYERQRALLGIADTYDKEGRFGLALETYQNALSIAHEHSYSLCSARALAGISRTHLRMGSTPSARAHAERALAMYRSLGANGEAAELRRLFDDWGATGS